MTVAINNGNSILLVVMLNSKCSGDIREGIGAAVLSCPFHYRAKACAPLTSFLAVDQRHLKGCDFSEARHALILTDLATFFQHSFQNEADVGFIKVVGAGILFL